MMTKEKSLKRITMTTGVIAMTIGLVNSFSFEAHAASTTGGRWITQVVKCIDPDTKKPVGDAVTCVVGGGTCTPKSCPTLP